MAKMQEAKALLVPLDQEKLKGIASEMGPAPGEGNIKPLRAFALVARKYSEDKAKAGKVCPRATEFSVGLLTQA